MHRQLNSVLPAMQVVLASGSSSPAAQSQAALRGGGGGGDEAGRRSSGGDSVAEGLSTLSSALIQEYMQLQHLVARAAASLFGEYEDVVARDVSKILPPDGTIHPLTAQVVSYVKVSDWGGEGGRGEGGAGGVYPTPVSIITTAPAALLTPLLLHTRLPGPTHTEVVVVWRCCWCAVQRWWVTATTPSTGSSCGQVAQAAGWQSGEQVARVPRWARPLCSVHDEQRPLRAVERGGQRGSVSAGARVVGEPQGSGGGLGCALPGDHLEPRAGTDTGEGGGGGEGWWGWLWALGFSSGGASPLLGPTHGRTRASTPAACIYLQPTMNKPKAELPSDVGRLKPALKETFSSVNAAVERIYSVQSGWTVPDAMLKEAVKRVVKNDLLKPYQDFLRK